MSAALLFKLLRGGNPALNAAIQHRLHIPPALCAHQCRIFDGCLHQLGRQFLQIGVHLLFDCHRCDRDILLKTLQNFFPLLYYNYYYIFFPFLYGVILGILGVFLRIIGFFLGII